MKNSLISNQNKKKHEFYSLISTLDALSPLKVINRGYSIVEKDGKTINSIQNVNKDEQIKIRLNDGNLITKVVSKEEK